MAFCFKEVDSSMFHGNTYLIHFYLCSSLGPKPSSLIWYQEICLLTFKLSSEIISFMNCSCFFKQDQLLCPLACRVIFFFFHIKFYYLFAFLTFSFWNISFSVQGTVTTSGISGLARSRWCSINFVEMGSE